MPGNEGLKRLDSIKSNGQSIVFGNFVIGEGINFYRIYCMKETLFNGLMTAAALKIYKADNGDYPDNTDQLVPKYLEKAPVDRFSNDGRFVYIKKGSSQVLLYSCGPDLKDDGGVEKPNYKKQSVRQTPDGDIVFLDVKPGK